MVNKKTSRNSLCKTRNTTSSWGVKLPRGHGHGELPCRESSLWCWQLGLRRFLPRPILLRLLEARRSIHFSHFQRQFSVCMCLEYSLLDWMSLSCERIGHTNEKIAKEGILGWGGLEGKEDQGNLTDMKENHIISLAVNGDWSSRGIMVMHKEWIGLFTEA